MTAESPQNRSFFLSVPGVWPDIELIQQKLQNEGIGLAAEHDEQPPRACVKLKHQPFAHEAYFADTIFPFDDTSPKELGLIDSLLTLEFRSGVVESQVAIKKAARILQNLGGRAIRVESTGAMFGWHTFFELLSQHDGHGLFDLCVTCYSFEDAFYTIGMGALGHPDVGQEHNNEFEQTLETIESIALWIANTTPELTTGQTFLFGNQSRQYTLERTPDTRFNERDGRYNPLGTWLVLPVHEPSAEGSLEPQR